MPVASITLACLGRKLTELQRRFPALQSSDSVSELSASWSEATSEFNELLKDPALEG